MDNFFEFTYEFLTQFNVPVYGKGSDKYWRLSEVDFAKPKIHKWFIDNEIQYCDISVLGVLFNTTDDLLLFKLTWK